MSHSLRQVRASATCLGSAARHPARAAHLAPRYADLVGADPVHGEFTVKERPSRTIRAKTAPRYSGNDHRPQLAEFGG
jgi:hypothetical protein